MAASTYSLNEFVDHFNALGIVRSYEHIGRRFGDGPEQVEIGNENSFENNALRVMDYFHQIYPDRTEARNKSVIFLLALSHIEKYRDSYDNEHFAVFSEQGPSMISLPLVKALHYHFTKTHYTELGDEDILVEAIKSSAREFMNE
jgi:hypothetical protein